jgi:hypothetical protein
LISSTLLYSGALRRKRKNNFDFQSHSFGDFLAELMFVVQELQDASNYRWWSRGGTVTLGKAHSFKIEVVHQDGAEGDETMEEKPGEDAGENVESPFVIENGILTGIKDPSLTQVVLPAEVKTIASGAFRDSHIESLVLNEGLL